MKLGENTWVYTELGLMTAPGAGTGSGNTYPNVTNIAGTNGYAIFDKNNKICGTDYTWEVGEWYHIKHIIDMENMTSTVYVTHEDIGTDVMVLSTPITTKGSCFISIVFPIGSSPSKSASAESLSNTATLRKLL